MASGSRNNKTSFVQIPLRFEVKPSKAEGILNYDIDNAYPQRVKLLTSGSVSAQASLRLFKHFCAGQGFTNETLGKSIANSNGQTFNELHGKISSDYADFFGVAIHLQYNGLLQIEAYEVVDFQTTRLTTPDSKEHANQIAIYNDWAKVNGRYNPKEVKYVDFFTADQELIKEQIERAGGFENWNGQIFWFSKETDKYPTPIYDAVIGDIETEAEISEGKKSEVMSSFLASHVVKLKQEFESEHERARFVNTLEDFQGNKKRGKMMLIDGVTDENEPIFEKVETATNDRLYEFTETSVADNIRRCFLSPRELVGQEYSSGFETDRIDQARAYYNSITDFDREELSKIWSKILPLYKTPLPVDYTIKKLYE